VFPGYLADTLSYLGYIDQARARMKEALSDARQLGHAHTLAQVLHQACRVELFAGSPQQLQRYAEETVAISDENGFPHWLGLGTIYWGASLTAVGQVQEGLTLLTKGLLSTPEQKCIGCSEPALTKYSWRGSGAS
jgi:hypothetical protein